MATLHDVLVKPLLSEKSAELKDSARQVVLQVAKWATKDQIARAAKQLFNVEVLAVNTIVVRGKVKRVGKYAGKQTNWKKAVLTVKNPADVDAFGILSALPSEEKEAVA